MMLALLAIHQIDPMLSITLLEVSNPLNLKSIIRLLLLRNRLTDRERGFSECGRLPHIHVTLVHNLRIEMELPRQLFELLLAY